MKHNLLYPILILLFITATGVITYLGYYNYLPEWFGLGTIPNNKDTAQSKTLWDWLELLIIPLVLAIGGLLYKKSENNRIEKKELKKDREEKIEKFFDSFLNDIDYQANSYFHNQGNGNITAKNKLNLLLSQIDNKQKGLVLQFLFDSKLLEVNSALKLNTINFSDVNADNIVLRNVFIKGTWFSNGSFKEAYLSDAKFSGCNFKNADFSNSEIKNVKFDYCDLTGCKLEDLDLTTVNFKGSILNKVSLKNSIINQEQLDKINENNKMILTNTKINER